MNTILNDRNRIILLGAASLVIVGTAWGFELIGGFAPCKLCLEQRWAYYFAIALSPAAYLLYRYSYKIPAMIIISLIGAFFLYNAGLGVYHAGIEWKWWPGPDCSNIGEIGGSGSLLDRIKAEKVVRCDEAQGRFLGLSFAGYNVIASLMMAMFCAWALLTSKR